MPNNPFSLTWMPDVLLKAGLKVALVDGWEYRGRAEMGAVYGVLCHHTAGVKTLNMPSLNTLIKGRPDLAGPLAQLGLGRDGTYYVIAAGRCNHSGAGSWRGVSEGNTHFIGIEAENTGLPDDPWPESQMDAYRFGVAAILQYLSRGVEWCSGHKEYALPEGRKDDPTFDMAAFRAAIASLSPSAMPPSIAAAEAPNQDGTPGRATLRRGDNGPLVETLQSELQITPVDSNFGSLTEAAVRVFQRQKGLVPDGIVGPKTWQALG